ELTVLRAFDSIMTNLSYEVLSDMILNLGTRLLRGQASLLFLAGEQGQREEAYAGPEPNGSGDLRRLLVEMSDFVLQSKRPLSVPDAAQSPWTQYLLGRQDVQGSITITPLLQQVATVLNRARPGQLQGDQRRLRPRSRRPRAPPPGRPHPAPQP